MTDGMSSFAPKDLDLKTHLPHPARVYDYLLGGKDNFEPDRVAAAHLVSRMPNTATSMRANRNFMVRVVRYLAAEHGIRQFLDIGTGLPTSPNLHEVVQEIAPESRVLYVDNDPIVLVHARALLVSNPAGRTAYLDADLRDPDGIMSSPQLRETLDLSKPVAVTLIAIVHFIPDEEEVHRIIHRLMDPLAPGSVLALSTITYDGSPEEVRGAVEAFNSDGMPLMARTSAQVAELFDGLDLIEPGVVRVNHWHPDEDARVPDTHVHMFGGAAIKP
ncbi:SAM-dependent methyltransferase [Thermopolyspora sp. NPDC052614]|uniref:SAM-dependent methyltransferase n=1 Tax=Thermopolyspora sp. NPDC052614 TaxID=3155682 RepID=UPI00343E8F03